MTAEPSRRGRLARRLALAVLAASVLTGPADAGPCQRPRPGDARAGTPAGTVEYGDSHPGTGIYAAYLAPDGSYAFAEAGDQGLGAGAGRGPLSAFVGVGPAYGGDQREVCWNIGR